jgi:hypothetical protein
MNEFLLKLNKLSIVQNEQINYFSLIRIIAIQFQLE